MNNFSEDEEKVFIIIQKKPDLMFDLMEKNLHMANRISQRFQTLDSKSIGSAEEFLSYVNPKKMIKSDIGLVSFMEGLLVK